MKIRIVAVGKVREKFFSDGIAEYLKRASRWADVSVTEVDDFAVREGASGARETAMEREGERILPLLRGYCFVTDIAGEQPSSVELSAILAKGIAARGEATFVIGGSYGLSSAVKARADYLLSFGRLTFPHQMARMMTAEQIYRSLAISAGHPYHK